MLTVVWMTARLVLPLQAHCPHHATPVAEAETNSQAPMVNSAEHAAHHTAHASAIDAPDSGAPAESAPAPCECAAHCCAAASVVISTSLVSVVPVPPLLQRTEHVLAVAVLAPRDRPPHRQPPATAPPLDSDLG
jgi:hypothetical protein